MQRRATAEGRVVRQLAAPAVGARHQVRARLQLHVDAPAAQLLSIRPDERRNVERRIGAGKRKGLRVPFAFVVAEEVHLVLNDRSAERPADLLIRVGEHLMDDEVGGIEFVAAEIARQRARVDIGSRLGDGVHLCAARPSLRGVEPARDELELLHRVAAEARLSVSGLRNQLRDLLTIQIQLERAGRRRERGRIANRVRSAAGREHRQLHPVAAVDRQFLNLPRVHVATEFRAADVDERGFRRDRDGFRHGRQRHLEVDHRSLTDEQLDVLLRDGAKALQLGGHFVDAAPQSRYLILAGRVGDSDERIAGVDVKRGHRHAGQTGVGGIGDRAGKADLLCVEAQRDRDQRDEGCQ